MSAGVLFGLNVLAYALVLIFIAVLAVIACIIGIKWRKSKDAKAVLAGGSAEEKTET